MYILFLTALVLHLVLFRMKRRLKKNQARLERQLRYDTFMSWVRIRPVRLGSKTRRMLEEVCTRMETK